MPDLRRFGVKLTIPDGWRERTTLVFRRQASPEGDSPTIVVARVPGAERDLERLAAEQVQLLATLPGTVIEESGARQHGGKDSFLAQIAFEAPPGMPGVKPGTALKQCTVAFLLGDPAFTSSCVGWATSFAEQRAALEGMIESLELAPAGATKQSAPAEQRLLHGFTLRLDPAWQDHSVVTFLAPAGEEKRNLTLECAQRQGNDLRAHLQEVRKGLIQLRFPGLRFGEVTNRMVGEQEVMLLAFDHDLSPGAHQTEAPPRLMRHAAVTFVGDWVITLTYSAVADAGDGWKRELDETVGSLAVEVGR